MTANRMDSDLTFEEQVAVLSSENMMLKTMVNLSKEIILDLLKDSRCSSDLKVIALDYLTLTKDYSEGR